MGVEVLRDWSGLVAADLRWMAAESQPRRLRTLREFMEQEVRLPDGPDKGLRFRVDRQPYTALWFSAHADALGQTGRDGARAGGALGGAPELTIDNGQLTTEDALCAGGNRGLESPLSIVADCSGLNVFILLGPTQSGKTLSGFVGPAMYHHFEIGESTCCGVPDENMVNDKWNEDFLPAIRESRYADLLPTSGQGARGGRVTDAVRFRNGTTLKFLTGGGDDKSVAGFTSRVLFLTELNKFGQRSSASMEGNRFAQMVGRLRAYGSRALVYGECTVDTEQGLVWSEYMGGTGSRIAMPCGYCGDYVTMQRENLVGWEDAKTVVEASRLARWACGKCGTIWAPGDREVFARGSVLVHRGQEILSIDNGQLTMDNEENTPPAPPVAAPLAIAGGIITAETAVPHSLEGGYCFDASGLEPGVLLPGYGIRGARPETFTLGLRWTAADNMFTDAGRIGMEEWKRVNVAVDEESAERELRQFVWAMPIENTSTATLTVSAEGLRRRQSRSGRGVVPEGWECSAFLDLGQRVCHWAVVARPSMENGEEDLRYQVIDVGVIEVPSGDIVLGAALKVAMWLFHDRCEHGWMSGGEDLSPMGFTELDSVAAFFSPPPKYRIVKPSVRFIDSGNWRTEVYEFVKEVSGMGFGGYFASKGHGMSQAVGARVYAAPDALTEKLPYVGDRYHVRLQEAHGVYLVHMDSDEWKTRVHGALTADLGAAGSLVLWKDDPHAQDIWSLAKHLVSEVGIEEFDPKRGMVRRWHRKSGNNHWFDAVYGCFVALDYAGQLTMDNGQLTTKKGPAVSVAPSALPGPGPADGAGAGPGRFGGGGVFRWDRD